MNHVRATANDKSNKVRRTRRTFTAKTSVCTGLDMIAYWSSQTLRTQSPILQIDATYNTATPHSRPGS